MSVRIYFVILSFSAAAAAEENLFPPLVYLFFFFRKSEVDVTASALLSVCWSECAHKSLVTLDLI